MPELLHSGLELGHLRSQLELPAMARGLGLAWPAVEVAKQELSLVHLSLSYQISFTLC